MPPPPGWIKPNFDGAFDIHTGKASIGGLARDPYGNLLMALNAEVRATHPLEAELIALQRGLHHVSHLAPPELQIEGDCLILVTSIRNSGHLSWDLMPLWRRTMDTLTSFAQWTIHYCKRSANQAANILACYEILVNSAQFAELLPHIKIQMDAEKESASAFIKFVYYDPPDHK